MKLANYKKILIVAVALFVIFAPVMFAHTALADPNPAPAPAPNPAAAGAEVPAPSAWACAKNIATCSLYYASLILNKFIGEFVTLGAALVAAFLQLNTNIFTSPVVQTGFSITLAIANLGFVLGIIVIALATILRNQTYGIKQLLWKLVVMAILVNFGLVIAGPIVGIADSMSTYFVNAAGHGGPAAFATNMATAFAPQGFTAQNPPTVQQQAGEQAACAAGSAAGAGTPISGFGSLFGCYFGKLAFWANDSGPSATGGGTGAENGAAAIMNTTVALIFSAIFLALTAFSFFALAVLLIVRYVYLTMLLILLPLAWLTWVFPKFSHSFDEWWSTFIKWAFFPALSLMFIYLAMLIAPTASGQNAQSSYISSGLKLTNVVTGQAANPLIDTAQAMLTDVVLCALVLGGLFAAQKIGIKGADAAIGMAKSTGGAMAGYVGRKTGNAAKKAGVASLRSVGGQKIATGFKTGFGGRVSRIPLLGTAVTATGRAMESRLSNKSMVDEAKKKLSDNPHDLEELLKGRLSMEETLAAISKLAEKGELKHDTKVRGQNVGDFLDSNGAVVARYGQEKTVKDVDKQLGGDKEMRAAAKEAASDNNVAAAMDKLRTATDTFVSKLEKTDIAKMNVNDMFSNDVLEEPGAKIQREEFLKSMAVSAPQLISSLMPKMKSQAFNNLQEMFPAAVEKGKAETAQKKTEAYRKSDELHNQPESPENQAKIDALAREVDQLNRGTEQYGAAEGRFIRAIEKNIDSVGRSPGGGGAPAGGAAGGGDSH